MTGATLVVGLGNFAFNIVVARQGGPAAYGAVAPLLAVAAVSTVLMTATTFAVARMVVASNADPRRALRGSVRAVIPWLVLSAVLLVFAQPLAAYLHLSGPELVVFAVLFGATSICGGAPVGVLLGMRRYGLVAALMLTVPAARLLAFEVLLSLRLSVATATLIASVLAACVCLAAGVAVVVAMPVGITTVNSRETASLARESVTGALLAGCLWVIWAIPVLAARHVLTPSMAGDFAAVQLVATGVVYLASPVVTVFYPLIAHEASSSSARRGFAVTAVIALVAGLGLILIGPGVSRHVYGSSFASPRLLFGPLAASAAAVAIATYGFWAARAAKRFTKVAAATVACSMVAELAAAEIAGRDVLALAAVPVEGFAAGIFVVGACVLARHSTRHVGVDGYSAACLACLALRT